jgi:hypothetical protein
MQKVGTVTITLEPHVIEATMYIVKDTTKTKLPPTPQMQQQNLTQSAPPSRPILQYGPPNGSMPPLSTPASATASPASQVIQPKAEPPTPTPASAVPQMEGHDRGQSNMFTGEPSRSTPTSGLAAPNLSQTASPSYPPRPPSALATPVAQPPPPPLGVSSQPTAFHQPQVTRPPSIPPPGQQFHAPGPLPQTAPKNLVHPGNRPQQPLDQVSTPSPGPQRVPTPAQGAGAPKPAAHDPVIALLAQKASGDPELRDLMKRVAVGQAKEGELAHFQKIIDQLNAEYRRGGGQQGPSADRLLVDGRTVKYFADEVRTILDIVLASNPNQKSADLRPPPRSDPLVVLLVKTALEDQRTKDMIRRIAEGRPGYTDATDLKQILDRLHRDMKTAPQGPPPAPQGRPPAPAPAPTPTPNGHLPNGQSKSSAGPAQTLPTPQALRSKGPPPAPKPDISAVVFDFGTGDRYLFPKYSILEFANAQHGHQVVVSFLIVRKGSISEYGGDPELDYYQPVTMRISSQTGRHLEHLARVVAPQEDVRRYMDDVMDNMTRAEYVLLAMRLPRAGEDTEKDGAGGNDEPKTNGSTPQPDAETAPASLPNKPGVLWTSGAPTMAKSSDLHRPLNARDIEDESQLQYQRLINSVAAKDQQAV